MLRNGIAERCLRFAIKRSTNNLRLTGSACLLNDIVTHPWMACADWLSLRSSRFTTGSCRTRRESGVGQEWTCFLFCPAS